MSDRQAALVYGATAACAVALALLIFDFPSARNLLLSIIVGIVVGISAWFHLERQ